MLFDYLTLLFLEFLLFFLDYRGILGLFHWLLKDFEHLVPTLLLLVIGLNLISHRDVILGLILEQGLGGLHRL